MPTTHIYLRVHPGEPPKKSIFHQMGIRIDVVNFNVPRVTKNKNKTILKHFWSLPGKNTKFICKKNKKEHCELPTLFQNDFQMVSTKPYVILLSRTVPEIHMFSPGCDRVLLSQERDRQNKERKRMKDTSTFPSRSLIWTDMTCREREKGDGYCGTRV